MAGKRFSTDDLTAYDLAPPPPTVSHDNAEWLAERLFSVEHLNIILDDPSYFQRFRAFLNRYRPQSVPTLVKFLESQKALTAIRYANALADQLASQMRHNSRNSPKSDIAMIDPKFENSSRRLLDELVNDALPAYITYRMVTTVTECLVKEITGGSTPVIRDLVQGLAEVYCMTDPKQPDNPIVFASEEFYNTTQYGREYVIGRNCRFLQGPKTSKAAIKRIFNAISNNQDISEIILNYRRDGSPFLNLASPRVMTAPLMDHHGETRYFIGAQIDISHLIEGGRGLESFKQLLDQEQEALHRVEQKVEDANVINHRPSLKLLRELSGLLNDDEIEVVTRREGRRNSMESSVGASNTPPRSNTNPHRRFVGMDDPADGIWPPTAFGPSGRLPGVYQNYILVRPYPSLRIIFTSAALRIPGLSQSKLMDRIGGPQHVRDGLLDALSQGIGVTAKVSWLTHSTRHGSYSPIQDETSVNTSDPENFHESRPRWIHCTPLLGSDSQPGVIMIVMVDKEDLTGTLSTQTRHLRHVNSRQAHRLGDYTKEGWPLRGMGPNGSHVMRSTLYADYLRREGRSASQPSNGRIGDIGGIASLHSPTMRSGRSTGGWSTPHRGSIGGREEMEESARQRDRDRGE
ncbi:hypothetical protein K458DRAFT_288380 [Lentithecium fluviatile CBS 122367]|uniref:PAC domain-containing protein n=1 Tax=Lentithecium fluviatile CBS 122367 TaxID=1168545 RepID=A0A6G1JLY5_9PLEO|nr:hypothetical protein K458DRAFT_288380 [Lentithecium fluviatile CBS 122367]